MMSQTKKLSIAFYWHMHQPVYQLTPEGDYLMPWVRLHAIKDYLDMVNILDKFKKIKLNFDLVPVLLDALIDYGEKNIHDVHSRISVKQIDELTKDDKEFILNNFFDANYQTMIFPNEEYNRLYQKRVAHECCPLSIFSDQEYSDLMALFNLAWFNPNLKNKHSDLRKLIKKGKGYSYEDRVRILELQREIIREIIPAYKKYLKKGKIEITTSPYYHPILPIMLDVNGIKKSCSGDLPNDLKMGLDAKMQTELALDRIEELFGKRPKGVWPSEHCVSSKTLDMFKDLGLEWTISDEGILSSSINFEFVRDFKGYLEDPYHLLKSYEYKNGLKIIFRDAIMPNLISFEYPNHDTEIAANDLYDRIKIVQGKLLTSPDDNHLLTIAMDGENCWENYPQDGMAFLKTLYKLIEEDKTLETVLISDYIEQEKYHKPLKKIYSGSWINRNFKLWIDEPLKNLAWTYLKRVRDDFSAFVKENPLHPNIENARKELFICEGSDWFWWYGEPNDSGRDNIFDYLYREHLKNIYLFLELEPPKYLDIPLTSAISKPSRYPKGEITPQITGIDEEDDSWLNAGCIDIPDGPLLSESKYFDKICFGYDKDNFYLRLYINEYILENPSLMEKPFQLYLYTRNVDRKQPLSPMRLINKTENVLPVSKEKFHNEVQLAVQGGKIQLIRLIKAIPNNLWVLKSAKDIKSVYDNVIDLSIPFELLDVRGEETMEFCFVNANLGIKDFFIPNDMLLSVKREKSEC